MNIINQQRTICQKEKHLNSPFVYLNLAATQKNNVLACNYCLIKEKLDPSKLLSIQQLQDPDEKDIDNWPRLQDKETFKKCQQIIKGNFFSQNGKCQQLIQQTEQFFDQKIAEILKVLKEEKCRKIKSLSDLMNLQQKFSEDKMKELFDIEGIRNNLNQFLLSDIDLQQFYENLEIINNSTDKQEEYFKKLIDQFQNSKIEINNNMEKIKENLEEKIKEIKKIFDTQIKFNASNKFDSQNYIKIESEYKKIVLQYNQLSEANNVMFSSDLIDKNKTYHIKFNFDNQQKENNSKTVILIGFSCQNYNYSLYDPKVQTNCYQDLIYYDKSIEGNIGIFNQGKIPKDYLDKNTVINLVFNFNRKILRIYDDELKMYLNAQKIDTSKIIKPVLSFQTKTQQDYDLIINILDIQTY